MNARNKYTNYMNSKFYFKSLLILSLISFCFSCSQNKEKFAEEIKRGESKLFNDSIKSLNKDEANKVYLNYLKYVEIFPKDSLSPEFLFKAADLANGLNRHEESVKLFERVRNEYPEYQKTSTALFMEAFIYETELKNTNLAKEKYKEFIQKYPDHKLSPSAQASLDQLNANLTDEQLIKMFEEKNANN
jgi:TolA-binding protein